MKQHSLLLICVAGSLSWTACHGPSNTPPPNPATPVQIAPVVDTDAVYYDKYPATVLALNTVELRAQVSGFITGIFFQEGQVVQKGKPLYEIDRRKYEAAYNQAVANVASAKANLVRAQKDIDRYNKLAEQDAIAKQVVDNAVATFETQKAQLEVAEAAVRSAATDLDYATIRAPFTGRIGISQVKLGAQVSPGTTLLNTISTEDPITVQFVVNQTEISRFVAYENRKGGTNDSTFKIQLPDGTMYNQNGHLYAIDRGVDNQTATINIKVEVPNPKDLLKDGMSVSMHVLNDLSGQRLIIPYKAITEQMGEFFVFVAKDSIGLQRKVHMGPKIRDRVVILDGINAGDQVITEGFQRLRDSGKISVVSPPDQNNTSAGAAPAASATPAAKPAAGEKPANH
ncbi:membrane fusion protein, multidrug efflux system [Chitinophaga costaii]|uniref:Membrane fusion protein, multidrug efflux system n=1 Tax=Chitinophaga costaii TaxID=1335309 RepID=A0A1C4CQF8_9BACT|nr:efflux RND transporter periplasmic adaptor subunit [Chitinophaga costaii]PUZ26995.1 efflux RND transporter periplasmic adaptor subunit [Chitinophaga costaii]SCC21357.1 membrane fusion protein, multidrug efflux system [Chitinophaga costaii]